MHPEAWGTGCGQALCRAVFDHMRQTPAQAVIVWVLTDNIRARRFYERIGFTQDDGRRDITLFDPTLPEVRYRDNLR